MIGKLFAECSDSVAGREDATAHAPVYRGMASAAAMIDFKGKVSCTPEGKETTVGVQNCCGFCKKC